MILVLHLFIVLNVLTQQTPAAQQALVIEVNTNENNVIINGRALIFTRDSIIGILGKPGRTEQLKSMERYEEYGGPNGNTSDMVEVENHFMIYDDLGLVFRTRNGFMDRSKDPEVMFIYTKNKRSFDNRVICEKEPSSRFAGTIMINGEKPPLDKTFLPAEANYQTETLTLFKRNFGLTSYATQVDGIYSYSSPVTSIYLDNANSRKASVIAIHKPFK